MLCALLGVTLWPSPAAGAAAGTRSGRVLLVDRLVVDTRSDDSYVFRKRVSLRETKATRLAARNLAVAYASCSRCRAVAVAFQVVLAGARAAAHPGPPRVAVVVNRAFAINEECVGCRTLALAYQFVVVDQDPVTLSASGRRQLATVRHALSAVLRAAEPDDVIVAEVAALAARVKQVLAQNLRIRPAPSLGPVGPQPVALTTTAPVRRSPGPAAPRWPSPR